MTERQILDAAAGVSRSEPWTETDIDAAIAGVDRGIRTHGADTYSVLRASSLLRVTGELIVEVYWQGEHIANISRDFGPSFRIVTKRDVSVEIDSEHPDPSTGQPRRAVVGIRCDT
jgi:hypothetical protein